jgi:hypothetical protein
VETAVGLGCVLLGIGFIVLLVVLARRSAQRERERLHRLHGWAKRHGWTVTYRPAVTWSARLPGANGRGISLAISGVVNGRPVSVAEYSYTETSTSTSTDASGHTSTSTSSTTHHLIVTVVRVPRSYPAVSVLPRGALSKLGRSLFGDGATATGHAEFDRAFRVRSKVPQVAVGVVGPALIAEHLAGRLPAWSLYGDELLVYQPGRLLDPERIPALTGPLLRVAELLHR